MILPLCFVYTAYMYTLVSPHLQDAPCDAGRNASDGELQTVRPGKVEKNTACMTLEEKES